MSKKNIIILTVTLLAVFGFYFYLFKDSFRRSDIQISHTFRPNLRRRTTLLGDAGNESLNFGLNGSYRLTSVKVVPSAEFETNKYAHPLWELVTDSNSVPTRVFSYGMKIRGMRPAVKGSLPASLEGNVAYRLVVQAGTIKGEHIFTLPPEPAPASQ